MYLGRPGRGGGSRVNRTDAVTGGQQKLGRADVLADRAHVLVGRDGRAELGASLVVVDVLAHDHGIETVRERIAGVHDRERTGVEQQRPAFARADGLGGAHGNPVHR